MKSALLKVAADLSSYTRTSSGDGRLLVLGLTCAEAWIVPLICAGLGGPPAQAASPSATHAAAVIRRAKIVTVLFSVFRERE
jgi:hypothetical protein